MSMKWILTSHGPSLLGKTIESAAHINRQCC
jgi:hypothetical protein